MKFFQQLIAQLQNIFKELPTGKKITFFGTLVVSLIGLATLVVLSQRPTFEVLYSNLSPEDAGSILSRLKEQKISYRLSSNGTSILVPVETVYETRLGLASEGLPQGGGVGFEIFDRTKLGMTEFVQNVNYQRALQGELARTIKQLSEVEQARVHVVIPQKSLFVEDQKEATASVVLKLKPGAKLTQSQTEGVLHLVASSVEGLKPEKITIMDNHGRILAGGVEKSSNTQLTSSQLEIKRGLESDLETGIQTMLEKAVGQGKVLARVFATLDFKQVQRTEERYDPDSLVVRSETRLGENSKGSNFTPKGVPGVESNLPNNRGTPDVAAAGPEFQRKNETINYEISKTTSHIVEPIGDIQKISAAVIIDGTYEVVKGKDGNEEKKYTPRPEEEMEGFRNIVKMAVGYNADRGDKIEVVNIPFETITFMQGEEISEAPGFRELWSPILRFGVTSMALILLFLFVLRPIIGWVTGQRGAWDVTGKLPKTVGELEAEAEEMRADKSLASTRERMLELAKTDSERTAQLVRRWLLERK
ncbi:MAG: flagellar basal-body MS-ring/collar protein FliF [Pseudomonadota bacterium]